MNGCTESRTDADAANKMSSSAWNQSIKTRIYDLIIWCFLQVCLLSWITEWLCSGCPCVPGIVLLFTVYGSIPGFVFGWHHRCSLSLLSSLRRDKLELSRTTWNNKHECESYWRVNCPFINTLTQWLQGFFYVCVCMCFHTITDLQTPFWFSSSLSFPHHFTPAAATFKSFLSALHHCWLTFPLLESSCWHRASFDLWSADNKRLCHRGPTTICCRSASPDLSSIVRYWHTTKSSVSSRTPITENNNNVQPRLHLLKAEGELLQNTDEALVVGVWEMGIRGWGCHLCCTTSRIGQTPSLPSPSFCYCTLYGYLLPTIH